MKTRPACGNDDAIGSLPDDWKSGIIPYAINFFSPNPKRLLGLVKKGIDFLENSSCLRFEEQDPVKAAQLEDYTYLYYTYSGVAEDCCLKYYTKEYGRRTVLITPVCSDPHEVAHATLHGMGLTHLLGEAFSEVNVVPLTQGWCDGFLDLKATRVNRIVTTRKSAEEMTNTPRKLHRFVGLESYQDLRTSNNSMKLRTFSNKSKDLWTVSNKSKKLKTFSNKSKYLRTFSNKTKGKTQLNKKLIKKRKKGLVRMVFQKK